MKGFAYIRSMGSSYAARTPRGAFMAAAQGVAPLEAFVYRSLSVKPLFEEPYSLEELERALARPELSLGDAMLLVEILSDMTRGEDKELALFAAESLGALEGRWARRVEELGPAAEEEACEGGAAYAYARALYEYALIAGRYSPIRNYYLREAYYALSRHPEACTSAEGFNLRIRCLLLLGLFDQAEAVIASELGKRSDGELLLLAAEAAFLRKDPRRVREILAGRRLGKLGLGRGPRELLAGWMA